MNDRLRPSQFHFDAAATQMSRDSSKQALICRKTPQGGFGSAGGGIFFLKTKYKSLAVLLEGDFLGFASHWSRLTERRFHDVT